MQAAEEIEDRLVGEARPAVIRGSRAVLEVVRIVVVAEQRRLGAGEDQGEDVWIDSMTQ